MGGDIEGPFRSTNGGASYSRVFGNLAGGDRSAAAYGAQMFHYDPSGRVYMAGWGGLYRTETAGDHWDYLTVDEDFAEGELIVASVVVSPFDSNVILAGTGDVETNLGGTSSIYRSEDGGASFVNTTVSGVFQADDTVVHDLLVDPLDANVVFAGTGEGVLKSVDNGQTWTFVNNGLRLRRARRSG